MEFSILGLNSQLCLVYLLVKCHKMRYLTTGYNILVFSPLFSFLFLVLSRGQTEVTALIMTTSIIVVQICGMILYLIGYRKPSKIPPYFLLGGVFLIFWGFLVAWYIITSYNFHTMYYLPEKPLTFLDNVNYAAYVLKGLLWVASGLMLTITRISKTFRTHQSQRQIGEDHSIQRQPY